MNIITIAGRLGKDAEQRFTPNGKAVTSFSVADDQGKDKPTLWWNCQMWGERGEKLSPYLLKGSQVTVSGTVSEREYEGKKYYDVRVNDIALQGGKPDGQPAPAPRQQQRAPAPANHGGFEDMDEDIPFADPMKRRAFALSI